MSVCNSKRTHGPDACILPSKRFVDLSASRVVFLVLYFCQKKWHQRDKNNYHVDVSCSVKKKSSPQGTTHTNIHRVSYHMTCALLLQKVADCFFWRG